MAIRRFSTASIKTGSKSNKLWDQDTAQGAMVPLGSVNVVSNNSTQFLSFTNIPQNYQDLQLILSGRSARTGSAFNIHITTNSGQFFSGTLLFGDGGSAQSSRYSNAFDPTDGSFPAASAAAGLFGTSVSHILDYANTSRFKTTMTRFASDTNGGGTTGLYLGLTRSTNAVTTVNIYTDFADFWASGTTATLYGIKAGV